MTSTIRRANHPSMEICLSLFVAQQSPAPRLRCAPNERTVTPAMSQRDDDDDLEVGEREPLAGGHNDSEHPNTKYVSRQCDCAPGQPLPRWHETLTCYYRPSRSIHAMTRDEIRKGIANRLLHSRTYIILYLVMAALSITTVVLSMREGCPGLAFYILEIIINLTMIAEVAIRFLAFGRVSRIAQVICLPSGSRC